MQATASAATAMRWRPTSSMRTAPPCKISFPRSPGVVLGSAKLISELATPRDRAFPLWNPSDAAHESSVRREQFRSNAEDGRRSCRSAAWRSAVPRRRPSEEGRGHLHAANLRGSRNSSTPRRDRRVGRDPLALLPQPQRRRLVERGARRQVLALPDEVLSGDFFQRGLRRSPDLRASALLLADQERTGEPGEDSVPPRILHGESARDRSRVDRVRRHSASLQATRELEREYQIHQLGVAVLPDADVAALHLQ